MPALTLVSIPLCPYVQRAAISLAEKGVSFERKNVDLSNRPEWFKKISPLGKVPVLLDGEQPIFESVPILEYLEETQPNPLHPSDPLRRAQHRAWIEFGSTVLADLWVVETSPDRDTVEKKLEILRGKFERIESEAKGPWFDGEKFSLVDTVFGPVFRYFDLIDRLIDHGIFRNTPKVAAWRQALKQRPSVINAVSPNYPVLLERFVQNQKGYLASLLKQAA
ncbi:MAG: glutathione S-transferase family protein [Xanthobacteraceae bacterium]|nr:glutathione S-transferase family protein [Xanthobacteraceae bacterium]